jgi:hypothetical protein
MPDIRLIVSFCQDTLENRCCSVDCRFAGQRINCRDGRSLPNYAKHEMVFTTGDKRADSSNHENGIGRCV